MKKSIKKVLVIGSGPIRIGQAAEFDYSGSQACLSLREEGIKTVLINNNPATIQTDLDTSDIVYLEPITIETIERIIEKERPDGLLPTMGGQTGLNLAIKLHEKGILKKYGVKSLGTPVESIRAGESRGEFAKLMKKIGEPIPYSKSVGSIEEGLEYIKEKGYPVIIRPGFTLGGTGGGVAFNEQQFIEVAGRGLVCSMNKEVLVEEYVGGWKEIEFEAMRDAAGNCITVCSMENVDPMGIHTGDSIVVAPALTLNDYEYQLLRTASLKIVDALDIRGGCNIQFALHPLRPEYKVIEVNPRVSRSSALASKATGYPIARVAAKIALGHNLDEIRNDVTKETPASFEPTIDYVVVKVPRWPFDKFSGLGRLIGTEMRATGEVMAIGRRFEEALQKAIRSLDIGYSGIFCKKRREETDCMKLRALLEKPTDLRLFYIFDALKAGFTVDEIYELTKIDRWFLSKIKNIVDMERRLRTEPLSEDLLRSSKRLGFSDKQLSEIYGLSESDVRGQRKKHKIKATFKMVDTCAAEFEAKTPYYYSSYEHESEAKSSSKKKVIILGSGPIRIGQGIEFDYCTVHAVTALRKRGYETIIINNNPETVSTDFDTSDKLYFEPITLEDVLNVVETESKNLSGVIVQFGGQTAINMTKALHDSGVKILGTSPDAIDRAENRGRSGEIIDKLGMASAKWGIAHSYAEAMEKAREIRFPLLVRPSYVLGGAKMRIIYSEDELSNFVNEAMEASPTQQILLDKFLEDAVEVDVDAISDGKDVYIGGIMEHIEEAGIHSGDSACVIPSQTLSKKVIETLEDYTVKLAKEFRTIGLMNIQYAIKDGVVYVLEVNPRSSRTVPYVSKATGVPLAKIAARVVMGEKLKDLIDDFERYKKVKAVSVKEVVLPFDKLRIDPTLGPEMRSTGESMGIADNFGEAFYKALAGADSQLPLSGNVFMSVCERDKRNIVEIASEFAKLGFKILATAGTHRKIIESGVDSEFVKKISDGTPNAVDLIKERKIDLIINTPSRGEEAHEDGRLIRMNAVKYGVPYITTLSAAKASVSAIKAIKGRKKSVKSLAEYLKGE